MTTKEEYNEILQQGINIDGNSGVYEGINFDIDYINETGVIKISVGIDDIDCFTDKEIDKLENSINEIYIKSIEIEESDEDFENRTLYTL